MSQNSLKILFGTRFGNRMGGGLGMQGTSIIIGTRYAWNVGHIWDQVCVELW